MNACSMASKLLWITGVIIINNNNLNLNYAKQLDSIVTPTKARNDDIWSAIILKCWRDQVLNWKKDTERCEQIECTLRDFFGKIY